MSIFKNLESDFETFWNDKVKPFLHDDVEPVLKSFVQQFDSVFGKQALTASLEAVAEIPVVGFGPTAINLATTLYNDAKKDAAQTAELDATQVLLTVQSALQVAKASGAIATPADQTAAASISAPAA